MNVINLISVYGFGIKVAVSAAVVAATEILLKKFGGKLPTFIVNYLSLFIAFIAELIGNIITDGNANLSEELIYGGVIAYSLGTLLKVWIIKLVSGKMEKNQLFSLLKSITENLFAENSAAAISAIIKLLQSSDDQEALKERIIALLKKRAKEDAPDKAITSVAEVILQSAKQLKKEK